MFDTDKSFVEIEGDNLILSSVTKSENDTVLIRLYNPTEETVDAKLNLGFEFNEAYSVKLDGRKNEKLATDNNTVKFSVQKGKIYTIEVL